MGYGDLSCYGQKTLETPNIDQLAASGMKFTRHYAGATVCAPSRASLLTGKHAGHLSVRGNSPKGQMIAEAEMTIPKALKSKGYTSAIIGKWGVGTSLTPNDPMRCGFDEHYGYVNMWHAHNFFPEFLYKNGNKTTLEGNITDYSFPYREDIPEGTGVAKEKVTYALSEIEKETISFIDKNKAQPFFLYLALNMPHANNEAGGFLKDGMEVPTQLIDGVRVPDYGTYRDKSWPTPEKGFAQMMTLIDDMVGTLQQQLRALNISDQTLIVFASDNGPHQEGEHKVDFFDSNGPFRGQKRDLYEGGIRVPMIASWPGVIKAGSITDHPSAFWDILPTFCEIAGADIPSGIDGISLLPTLLGESQPKHDWLYWEFYERGGKQAIMEDNWKLVKLNVRDPEKETITELYDLNTDPSEENNLASDNPEIVERLESNLLKAHTPHPLLDLFTP